MTEDVWKSHVESLGEFIRTQRKLAKLSLRELAHLSDLSNAYLSQLERGMHEPSIRVVKSLAAAFDLPPEVLLERAGLFEEDANEGPQPDRIETAIRADRRLSDTQKQALLAVYRSFELPPSTRSGNIRGCLRQGRLGERFRSAGSRSSCASAARGSRS